MPYQPSNGFLELPLSATCKTVAIVDKAHKGWDDTAEVTAAKGGTD
jgi:hypothetical protein